MWPKTHIIYGFIFTFLLYIIFPQIGLFEAGLIFLSTVLIDVDHYFYYVFRNKNISLRKAINWFSERKRRWHKLTSSQIQQYQNKYKHNVLIFHGLEFVFLIAILTLYYPIFFWILIGISIHLLIDYRELMSLNMNPMIKMSQIYVYIKNKNKKDF
jgi:hypothetical protein